MYVPCKKFIFQQTCLSENYIICAFSKTSTPLPAGSCSLLLLSRSHADYHAGTIVLSSSNGGWFMYYYTISNVDTWSK